MGSFGILYFCFGGFMSRGCGMSGFYGGCYFFLGDDKFQFFLYIYYFLSFVSFFLFVNECDVLDISMYVYFC